jgi:Domain of unknown function (DUF4276)
MRLALALYGEGNTDDRFLTLILQRTSRKILAEYRKSNISVASVEPIKLFEKKPTREENILQAAIQAFRYQALIVHADADNPLYEDAMKYRILPGFDLVKQSKSSVCGQLLPIIPIQAVEAWMLADFETLGAELRTDLKAHELGIPEKTRQIEKISKPKFRLNNAIAIVNKQLRPNQRIDVSSLYEPLGRKIRLERLQPLSAYQRFESDLTRVFAALNLISEIQRM